jgi:hypothetical protein
MRNISKKVSCILTAALISAGTLSLAACGNSFTPVGEDKSAAVASTQGGFVASTADYYYFINGVESHTSDNTYGNVVKGALERVKKTDLKNKTANAKAVKSETIVPSLMVAEDYTSGLYIYDGRIYFATPNNRKDTSGQVQNEFIDFKSVKTDGTDLQYYFYKANSTVYRFVEVEGTVYVLFVEDNNLKSYNTKTATETTLVKSGSNYTFNRNDKTDPNVYYTMSVSYQEDGSSAISSKYNQLYRVSADVTKAPYEYTWDEDWLKDHDEPYHNYGTLVLDGIGRTDTVTQYNHDVDQENDNRPAFGYTYTMQTYENGGVYFKRAKIDNPGSTTGASGELYYLPAEDAKDKNWNTVSGNGALDVVANSVNTSKATDKAIYYLDENSAHHYLYVSGQYIYRADVAADGSNLTELEIAYDVSDATLVALDQSDADYKYVYFTRSSSGGQSVERAVYNGTEDNYTNLTPAGQDNSAFKAAKVLNVQHASGWYNYEVIDNVLFYANSEAFGGTTYSYVYTVDLERNGKAMNNVELEAFNEKYDEIFNDDAKEGYLAKVTEESGSKLSSALKYYFYTGETALFDENIAEAVKEGKKNTYLYTEEEQKAFKEFAEGKGDAANFKDGEVSYFDLGYFTTFIGEMSEADAKSYREYWKNSVLEIYVAPTDDNEGLAWWAWLLIGIAIAAVVAAAVTVPLALKKKRKQQEAPKPEKMRVDTTDDKEVDVYHVNEESPAQAEEPVEEAEEVPAEAPETEPENAEEPAQTEPEEKE